jgi:SSS family solute:Na+ symporter
MSPSATDMAANMYRALWSWIVCVLVTVAVSYVTTPKTDAELNGLVYGVTVMPHEEQVAFYHRPVFWAIVVSIVFVILNLLLW